MKELDTVCGPGGFRQLTASEMSKLYNPPMIRMSEATIIQSRFDDAFFLERQRSGKAPTVAILGSVDYEALVGVVHALLESCAVKLSAKEKALHAGFSFKGVRIFKSHSSEHGITMGGEETTT